MRWSCRARRARAASRSGMTLIEVMLALAIFMIGSVSVVGLFATASVMHAEAVNRRTASFIAADLLAQVRSMRFREVSARTKVDTDGDPLIQGVDLPANPGSIVVLRTGPDVSNQAADFIHYPLVDLFFALPAGAGGQREEGPILIEGEWMWAAIGDEYTFSPVQASLWDTPPAEHPDHSYVLQPRTWFYVVNEQIAGREDENDNDIEDWKEIAEISVKGDPLNDPPAPVQGYIVIDEEWMRYDGVSDLGIFVFDDFDNNGAPDRGLGGTEIVRHRPGTPVTVAREHPSYPGFYYTVQFYPVNASGASAHVVVCVAYTTGNMLRVHTFRSIYTPASF